MREILFRGFHKCIHGNQRIILNGHRYKGNWIQGCYFVAKDKNFKILNYISEIKGEKIFKIIPETLGQYIGRTDKNGNKIFEGDIVKQSKSIYFGIVKFGEYGYNGDLHLGFYIDWNKKSNPYNMLRQDLMYWVNDGLEVIGNIHSNPKLLEVEE